MITNRLAKFGKQDQQPCDVCAGIRAAGPLKGGESTCPRCGARWFTPTDPLEDDQVHQWVGCALMLIALLGLAAIVTLSLLRGCRGSAHFGKPEPSTQQRS